MTSLTEITDIGEISRNMLLHLIDSSALFKGYSSPILNTHYGYDAAFVSKIEGCSSNSDIKKAIISDLGVSSDDISEEDCELVKVSVGMVAKRAAVLAACAIGAVILHTGNDKSPSDSGIEDEEDKGVDVGLDGSVAEFLPSFQERMREALRVIIGEKGEKRVRMGLAKDGSGVGGMSFPFLFGNARM